MILKYVKPRLGESTLTKIVHLTSPRLTFLYLELLRGGTSEEKNLFDDCIEAKGPNSRLTGHQKSKHCQYKPASKHKYICHQTFKGFELFSNIFRDSYLWALGPIFISFWPSIDAKGIELVGSWDPGSRSKLGKLRQD